VYQQQDKEEEQQDAENPFLDPPFSRIKRIPKAKTYYVKSEFHVNTVVATFTSV
jgi:hypothetical protein